ncbi:hypothetical protein CDAR_73691 [Caerostris darwini]|uniref:Uncharacterized protein n=1 Tax=Caerostris darwini TaxID=1538125 RepID=A0AAV4MSB9_9ARAC|nr:hypothetical protein CDAR_73691 [Caerostris darwini]
MFPSLINSLSPEEAFISPEESNRFGRLFINDTGSLIFIDIICNPLHPLARRTRARCWSRGGNKLGVINVLYQKNKEQKNPNTEDIETSDSDFEESESDNEDNDNVIVEEDIANEDSKFERLLTYLNVPLQKMSYYKNIY